jgi:hypothetical protein
VSGKTADGAWLVRDLELAPLEDAELLVPKGLVSLAAEGSDNLVS